MTFIIAEAGVNHGGNFGTALKLVDAAKSTGADAVKFQMFDSRKLWGDDRIKHLELSQPQMRDLAAYAKSAGIEFLCTPFGLEELEFITPLSRRIKIASGCLTNHDLLAAIRPNMPVILSTGMSTPEEIGAAVRILGTERPLALLHCTSSYPCRLEDVNLLAMRALSVHGLIGYSDHTAGITTAIAAVALGARIIEKHLTLDRNADGPDHKASITPIYFSAMVDGIRAVELALGDGIKRVMPCEEPLRKLWREKP